MCKVKKLRDKLIELIKNEQVLIIEPGEEVEYTETWLELLEEYKKEIENYESKHK